MCYNYRVKVFVQSGVFMENSFKYFENRDCKYYPCHEGMEHMNCLFCYCPLYFKDECPGSPEYIQKGDKIIKSCMSCTFPHEADNYKEIIKRLIP